MKSPDKPRIIEYQAVPESYNDLRRVHELLEAECRNKDGRAIISADYLSQMKEVLISEMPDKDDIDGFIKKACKELIICRAFSASNVFTHYVFADTVPLSNDLYQSAFAKAPGLEDQILANISKRYIPPLHGPILTNKFASQIRRR